MEEIFTYLCRKLHLYILEEHRSHLTFTDVFKLFLSGGKWIDMQNDLKKSWCTTTHLDFIVHSYCFQ